MGIFCLNFISILYLYCSLVLFLYVFCIFSVFARPAPGSRGIFGVFFGYFGGTLVSGSFCIFFVFCLYFYDFGFFSGPVTGQGCHKSICYPP